MNGKLKQAVYIFSAVLLLSCKHDIPLIVDNNNNEPPEEQQPCSSDTVYFKNTILPLLLSNCAMSGCHDAITSADGVQLTTYSLIMSTGDIEPGNPGNSKLYEAITETDPDKIMPRPPASPLTAQQRNDIFKWIQQGAKNNACNSCDTSVYTYSGSIEKIITDNCKGCHSGPNVGSTGGGILLDNYTNVKAQGLNGKLLPAVSHTGPNPMPKGGSQLSDCRITQIRKWIESNYPN